MGKRKNIVEFLADKLNDSTLKENSENINIGMIISNNAPKRTTKPLTQLSINNELSAILELSKYIKKRKKSVITKSAKSKKSVNKTKKRS